MIIINLITFFCIICIWFLLAEIVRKEQYKQLQKAVLFGSAAFCASLILAIVVEWNLYHMVDKAQYYKCVHVHEHSLSRPARNSIRWRR